MCKLIFGCLVSLAVLIATPAFAGNPWPAIGAFAYGWQQGQYPYPYPYAQGDEMIRLQRQQLYLQQMQMLNEQAYRNRMQFGR